VGSSIKVICRAGPLGEVTQNDATDPTFVRTVYRFGYRFVGEVTEDVAPTPKEQTRARLCLVFENRQVVLLEGANVIGRDPDAAIRCDATGVSRHHARILISKGEATVEDLESKNGTYVMGKRIASARLSDGDEIRLGVVSLIFRVDPPMTPTETVSADRH
jgi:hypothetical protein